MTVWAQHTPKAACAAALRLEPASISVTEVHDDQGAWWNGYLDRSGRGSLYHRYEWRGVIGRVFGKRGVYIAARDAEDRCLGVLPLIHMKSRLFGNYLVSMPYFNYGGGVADSREVLRALTGQAERLAQDLGCEHVEYRHDEAGLFDLPVKTHKVSMVLPLPAAADELWSGFKPKLRSQIRRPEKSGAKTVIGRAELLPSFYEVFAANMRDLGTPVYPRRFFREILDTFEDARVAVVLMGDQTVAAGILLGFAGRLEIPWASSLRSHNRFSPNMLLYWAALQWAIKSGYQTFDFGRCTRDSGTYRFKQQWGAQEHPLVWYYWLRDGRALPELNPDNPAYASLVRTWQKLPIALTKLLGPQIVKHLP